MSSLAYKVLMIPLLIAHLQLEDLVSTVSVHVISDELIFFLLIYFHKTLN